MKTFTRALLLVAVLTLVVVLVSGCALGGKGEGTTAAPSLSTDTTSAAPATVTTQEGAVTTGAAAAGVDATGDEVQQLLQRLTDANAAGDSLADVPEVQ